MNKISLITGIAAIFFSSTALAIDSNPSTNSTSPNSTTGTHSGTGTDAGTGSNPGN